MSRDLLLRLNHEYFDQVLSGEKTEEYREANGHWAKRLGLNRTYDNVVLTRGYPAKNGVEGVTRITRPWRGAVQKTIVHKHFGSKPTLVWAIALTAEKPAHIFSLGPGTMTNPDGTKVHLDGINIEVTKDKKVSANFDADPRTTGKVSIPIQPYQQAVLDALTGPAGRVLECTLTYRRRATKDLL